MEVAMAQAHGLTPEDRERMLTLTEGMTTKADKIRALGRAGFPRARIAEFLGIRYQHVRNVLVQDASATYSVSRAQDRETRQDDVATYGRARLDESGRIVLPDGVIAHLNLRAGGVVPWRLEDDELVLMSPAAGVRRAREYFSRQEWKSASLVDELLRTRREDLRKEEERERRFRAGGS
jgi:bifunctional DNA-binding transcriptional regulator/antitoxin component of YhaV-PrlF toxin-antitoxin module